MVSPLAAGFVQGFAKSLSEQRRLTQQDEQFQQTLDVQKENLKLRQQQLKGLEATAQINRAKDVLLG